jgi:hypothetical protein
VLDLRESRPVALCPVYSWVIAPFAVPCSRLGCRSSCFLLSPNLSVVLAFHLYIYTEKNHYWGLRARRFAVFYPFCLSYVAVRLNGQRVSLVQGVQLAL